MSNKISTLRIDKIRANARQIVRELGFTQKGLAGTNLGPSAVHTIIELGYGTVSNAGELGVLLRLEKSSISRLVGKLKRDGLISVDPSNIDRRSRLLTLTADGQQILSKIEKFARQQLHTSLDTLSSNQVKHVESGLSLFAEALDGSKNEPGKNTLSYGIHAGYRPGVIASVTNLHAHFYSMNFGFGAIFERKVATEMSAFMERIENPLNTTFSAYSGEELIGSISLDSEDLEEGTSHLRWFIVHPKAHGLGVGNLLLKKATEFVDKHHFVRTRLWTFEGLEAARHLYERHGFSLVQEQSGTQWGTKVVEQEFERISTFSQTEKLQC